MSLLSAAVASNATSQSIVGGSLVFNPIITLDSPEAQIRQTPTIDTSAEFRDTTSTGTAKARATISTSGEGGEDEEAGFAPTASLGSSRQSSVLKGDLVGGTRSSIGQLGILPMLALGVGVYFVAKRFF